MELIQNPTVGLRNEIMAGYTMYVRFKNGKEETWVSMHLNDIHGV